MDGRTFYVEIDGIEFKDDLLKVDYSKFISSTGSRAIIVTYKPDITRYNVEMATGVQTVNDIIDKSSRYIKFIKGKKYIIFKRELITIGTVINSKGDIVKTIKGHYIEDVYYKVKNYDVYMPFPDFLGGDIKINETEEIEFHKKDIIRNNSPEKVKLSECRQDYIKAVEYVTEATAKLAKSLSQSLSEKVQAPFSNLGTVVTFVGGIATFWSNKTKNPWIIAAGTTATYIGVATTAMVMVLGGVEPKDMVIEFPQKENRTFGGVYTNDYRNKKSLENTPDWSKKK